MRGLAKSGRRDAPSSPSSTSATEYTGCVVDFVWRGEAHRFIVFRMKRIVLGALVMLRRGRSTLRPRIIPRKLEERSTRAQRLYGSWVIPPERRAISRFNGLLDGARREGD